MTKQNKATDILMFCWIVAAQVNALWTRDPVFPYLLKWIVPESVNSFVLAGIRADTGAEAPKSLLKIIGFSFLVAIDHSKLGFWQFLGPLCLACAFLILRAVRNTAPWRVALTVWLRAVS